jgi:hypothetical protein
MPESHALGNTQDSTDLSGALKWRCIGPHRGGRVVAVAGHPERPMVFFFGACAGGVWKTSDGGTYWENVSDGFLGTAAVGAIQVSESDPNVIYVGTGESTIRGNVSHGDGVYRSTDGGRSWRHLGLADTRTLPKFGCIHATPIWCMWPLWGMPGAKRGAACIARAMAARPGRRFLRSDTAGAIDLDGPEQPTNSLRQYVEAQRTLQPVQRRAGQRSVSLHGWWR